MIKQNLRKFSLFWQVIFSIIWVVGTLLCSPLAAEESLCAVVKIEIAQELTIERQAFDAHMRINNGLSNKSLEQVEIKVTFADEKGNPVHATSDPNNTQALFFIRIDSIEGINNIEGQGTVQPASSADIHWLIIPAPGSGGALPSGTLYYVGATLKYTLGGEEQITQVTPDYIFVKPQPLLTLDYFLPHAVYADDAFTPEIEPSEPFTLGVRVKNDGYGVASHLKIDSAQPRIIENKQGLLIGFKIIGSTVNNQPTAPSLLVDFGDVKAGQAAVGRWQMTTTLSGQFTEFNADFYHADELGGELTSLIKSVYTHFLVKDVQVDLPGRDEIRDFLAKDGDTLRVYESHGLDTEVNDHSSHTTLQLISQSGSQVTHHLSAPVTAGFLYVKLPDPYPGTKTIKRVVRSDGKVLPLDNVWLSKTRRDDNHRWDYFINLFDSNSPGQYQIIFDNEEIGPQPPVLQMVLDRSTRETQQLAFLVIATDPNGTIPTLSATSLPTGATFTEQGDGKAIFDWTPVKGQAGHYEITFTASDGTLTTSQTSSITVYSITEDSDGDGVSDACEIQYFDHLGRDGRGDFDGDGISDQEECLRGTDPTIPNEPPPTTSINFSHDHYTVQEHDGIATLAVTYTGIESVTVNYATTDDTAQANQDYQLASGTIVWNEPGEKTFSIKIIDDNEVEGDEIFHISLSNANGDLLDTATVTIVSCQLYAVDDKGLNNSQLFGIDFLPLPSVIKAIGEIHQGYDIEALDLHPLTNVLYAASGDKTELPGHFYQLNKATGEIERDFGSTSCREVHGLSFNPVTYELWGWAQDCGLFVVQRFEPLEINIVTPSKEKIEDLTWLNDGTTLIGAVNLPNPSNPDSHSSKANSWLFSYNVNTNEIEEQCNLGLGEIEALETLPNGMLALGIHGKDKMIMGVITPPPHCELIVVDMPPMPYQDVEGIAWPDQCSIE